LSGGWLPIPGDCSGDLRYSVIILNEVPAGRYEVSATKIDGYSDNSLDIDGKPGETHPVALGPKLPSCEGVTGLIDEGPLAAGMQIYRVAIGSHQSLPAPEQLSIARGENPGWTIENATGYQVDLYLRGPVERHYQIRKGDSINVDLPPGGYRIAAKLSNESVLPFYAVRELGGGTRWKSHLYIGNP